MSNQTPAKRYQAALDDLYSANPVAKPGFFHPETEKNIVIWDIGGVGIPLGYGEFYKKASELAGITPEQFKKWYSPLEERALKGEIKKQDYFKSLREKVGNLSDQELRDLIGLFWKQQNNEIVSLMRRIHESGYTLGICSNMTDYALEILQGKYPGVFETFGGPKVYSFEHGVIKPDLRLYTPFNKMGFSRVVFIEDKSNYFMPGINNYDWLGIHYTEYQDPDEAIKSSQGKGDIEVSHASIRTASSVKEIEIALREFGFILPPYCIP